MFSVPTIYIVLVSRICFISLTFVFQVGCKASLVFFQYFIMANFFWLLVEGLYLHTLLIVIFSENRHFIVYMFIGWGKTGLQWLPSKTTFTL